MLRRLCCSTLKDKRACSELLVIRMGSKSETETASATAASTRTKMVNTPAAAALRIVMRACRRRHVPRAADQTRSHRSAEVELRPVLKSSIWKNGPSPRQI